MRVLQLIDSLRSGGAEKMSVTYANALAKRINRSYLCCTRMEGMLKGQLSPEVGYLFLNKKNTLDIQAFWKLRKYVKKNEIDIIQAHGSSWFLAIVVKVSLPAVKIVWHDHWGERAIGNNTSKTLRMTSVFFDGVIAVNPGLRKWGETNLIVKDIRFIRNFLGDFNAENSEFSLARPETFRIIHLANFKCVKDHLNLLKAFLLLKRRNPMVTLHLIGKDYNDGYSEEIKNFVIESDLKKNVFFYGEQQYVISLLKEADLGVLSSKSEGLPVALLEYGRAGLPVIATDVGHCAEVIGEAGLLVPPNNSDAFYQALLLYLKKPQQRKKDALKFSQNVAVQFSEAALIPEAISFYSSILHKKE